MKAIILSIGDELVLGQTVDTNSAWLSRQLAELGWGVLEHLTIPDDQPATEDAIRRNIGRCDAIIITGGLGPTADDLTRQAIAGVMNVPLELSTAWLEKLLDFWKKRGREMPEINRIQAMIPRGATMLDNSNGTAAGIAATIGSTQLFAMPGVPKEMFAMFDRDVKPALSAKGGGAVILSRTLHTYGLGESAIAEKLGDLMKRSRNPSVGTTVSGGVVSLRLNSRFESREKASAELEATTQLCRDALGDLIYGQDADTLAAIVGEMLKQGAGQDSRAYTVTTAESCTGGLLAKSITDVSGSSDYFKTGFVTYSNQAKYERLGVSLEIIGMYGAVSEPVVDAMARNAKRLAKADFALSISGVAGPTGGTATKPVGLVCIGLAYEKSRGETTAVVRTFNFPGDREMVRDRAAKMALTMLRYQLLGKPLPF